MNKKEKTLYYATIATMAIAYSPFKPIAFIYPFILIYILPKNEYSKKRLYRLILIYFFFGVFYLLINSNYLVLNYLIALLTLSPYLVLLIDMREYTSKIVLDKIVSFVTNFAFIQAIIGIIQIFLVAVLQQQGFDSGTGDYVTGTLNPLASNYVAGSNVMFAIMQSSIVIFVFVMHRALNKNIPIIKLSTIILSWLFATVMHTIILWIVTLCIVSVLLIGSARVRLVISTTAAAILMTVLTFWLFPQNLEYLDKFAERTFTTDSEIASTKGLATINTFYILPSERPLQPYVGLGPGQYSSRACLIASGRYLTGGIPIPPSVNEDFGRYILPLWEQLLEGPEWAQSSAVFPFYSWLTLFGEYGIIGVMVLLIYVIKMVRSMIIAFKKEHLVPAVGIIFIITYILLIGVQENYWEWSQPMMVVILIFKIVFDSMQGFRINE